MTPDDEDTKTSDHEPEANPRPIVAIVGRPNVGKSSLFNRLVGRKVAIVHDEPGVTRDRHYAEAWGAGRDYIAVDTGGFDPETDDPMGERIAEQVEIAIEEADVVVCVFDVTQGVTEADRQAVKLLRRARKPVIYAANKADTREGEADTLELYRLGLDSILPVSALHGRGFGQLERTIAEALPPLRERATPLPGGQTTPLPSDDPESPANPAGTKKRPMRIALIGRPNAGKSSLANRVLGQDRLLVDDRPGTTRDAIDIEVDRDGRSFVVVDTAGIRRKGKVTKTQSQLETASVYQAIHAIERCDIAVLVCDADAGVAEQDAKILGLAEDRGRGIVLALNKLDLLDKKRHKAVEEKAREVLGFVPWAPLVSLSAKTGRGVRALLDTCVDVHEALSKRVPTGELNRFFEHVLSTHPPPTMGSRAPRLYYVTQAETSPPVFVVITNEPDHIHFSYRRYVVNQLRSAFGFGGVPVRVVYKKKRRRRE